MKNTFKRTIDELGRIVIPKEIRSELGWGEKDILALQCMEDNTITLQLVEKHQGQKSDFGD